MTTLLSIGEREIRSVGQMSVYSKLLPVAKTQRKKSEAPYKIVRSVLLTFQCFTKNLFGINHLDSLLDCFLLLDTSHAHGMLKNGADVIKFIRRN